MTETERDLPQWRIRHRASNQESLVRIVAYWELEGDAISDHYTPTEINASQLMTKWASRRTPSKGLIPIVWYVKAGGLLELMPFQHTHILAELRENFLSFFSWPTDPVTGEQLNWLRLPVVDKFWYAARRDRGGFIQEATGWKPGILQPFVTLGSLLQGRTCRAPEPSNDSASEPPPT